MFADYIDWRAEHPSDDLMTELLQAEYEDAEGNRRRLTHDEVLNYVNLLAAAGNETTTRLIGWTGKVLAEHPDQRRELVEDRSLVPNAIEELLRFEPPSPVQARYVTTDVEHHGQVVPEGSALLLLNGRVTATSASSPTPIGSTSTAPSTTTSPSATASTSASVRRWRGSRGGSRSTRSCTRFPSWEVDGDNAVQARTSTVRGWESLPVITRG